MWDYMYQASCLQDGELNTWNENMLKRCSKKIFFSITQFNPRGSQGFQTFLKDGLIWFRYQNNDCACVTLNL